MIARNHQGNYRMSGALPTKHAPPHTARHQFRLLESDQTYSHMQQHRPGDLSVASTVPVDSSCRDPSDLLMQYLDSGSKRFGDYRHFFFS